MCEDLKLERIDNSPWGFRLTGGLDFGTPLTVVKATGGSIAELSGVQVGDLVVEINGASVKNLTHTDAQNCISSAGNYLNLKVMRGSIVTPPNVTPLRGMTPMLDGEGRSSPDHTGCEFNARDLYNQMNKLKAEREDESQDGLHSPATVNENAGQTAQVTSKGLPVVTGDVTDNDLDDLLTGNEEVLDQGIIGINFQKFIPQVDFIRKSEVFKFLQNENVRKDEPEELQLEKEPTKRFSTFLMKPKGPPARKPSGPFWHYPKAPKYLPRERPKEPEEPARKFFKEKPKEDDGHTVLWLFLEETGERVIDEKWGSEEEERVNLSRCEEREDQSIGSSRASTRIGFTADVEEGSRPSTRIDFTADADVDETVTTEPPEDENNNDKQAEEEKVEVTEITCESSKRVETSIEKRTEIARRLAEIQMQISALEEEVPGDLQTKLIAVQDQLTKILNVDSSTHSTLKRQTAVEEVEEVEESAVYEERSLSRTEERLCVEETSVRKEIYGSSEELREEVVQCEVVMEGGEENEEGKTGDAEENEEDRNETKDSKEESETIEGYQKGEYELCETGEEVVKKKPFHPITPQRRPIVLPGGRMWRRPKDAAHDDFYTGILVTQADVLVGSDTGVNFSKYVPPKFDMSNSAVYRLIHEIEEKTRGPKKEEEEAYNAPIDKRHFYLATLPEPAPIGEVELKDLNTDI